MKPSRRLGRGLEDLVPLAPAAADGTARLEDALRGGPAASVLALSGRSVEDFVGEESRPARPAPVPWTPPEPPAAQAEAPPAPRRAPPPPPPEPSPPESAPGVQFVLFDPPVVEEGDAEPAAVEAPVPRAAPPVPGPAARTPDADPRSATPVPTPPPPPARPAERDVVAEDAVFLDDEVGGIVLPDVELE